ncbi:MAG: nucleoside triphosphate pyrophosphohydrolase [Candidatus Pacebacteria bacterium]|nr:nucleoside triphosphate pyrophosphohydrolase [Candidatus Paceibacterota bacterium]
MARIFYNKLVRDKIPEVIEKSGGKYEIKKLRGVEYEKELIKKVGEEAGGLLAAKSKKELISELADVIDVINEIKRLKKISANEIKKAQEMAYERKGGFKKKLFLLWTSDTGYRSNERRYEK